MLFLQDVLVFNPNADSLAPPDPLMQQTIDFLQTWHHGRDADAEADAACKASRFQKHLSEFKDMWNGSFAGLPVHNCCPGHCASRDEAAQKMAKTFVMLLLSALPAVPSPNKWTKIFPASDFVGVGILVNNFLPNIFQLAFQPVMFSSDMQHEEADPRLVEGLYFHAVQGKRYASSQEFLMCPFAQWSCRCWLLLSEHLRRLVFYWLRNLQAAKSFTRRLPLCELLDPRCSIVWAVLQNISHQLLDSRGRERMCIMWKASGYASCQDWAQHAPEEVRNLRDALCCPCPVGFSGGMCLTGKTSRGLLFS